MDGRGDDENAAGDLSPALVTRTSGELLGKRALPQVITSRPVCFVLGPPMVGKTTVSRRLLGDDAVVRGGPALLKALTYAARYRKWPVEWVDAPALLLDDVEGLDGRFGVLGLVGQLLRGRIDAGRRTVLCQGPNDTTVTLLFRELPLQLRSSLLLRFPVGRGRRRFVANECRARGIECSRAREAVEMEAWSYPAVIAFLDALAAPSPAGATSPVEALVAQSPPGASR